MLMVRCPDERFPPVWAVVCVPMLPWGCFASLLCVREIDDVFPTSVGVWVRGGEQYVVGPEPGHGGASDLQRWRIGWGCRQAGDVQAAAHVQANLRPPGAAFAVLDPARPLIPG